MAAQNSSILDLKVQASDVEKASALLKELKKDAKAAEKAIVSLGDNSGGSGAKVAKAVDGMKATTKAAREASDAVGLVPAKMDLFATAAGGTASASMTAATAMSATTAAATKQADVVGTAAAGMKASLLAPAAGFTAVADAASASAPQISSATQKAKAFTGAVQAQAVATTNAVMDGQRPLSFIQQVSGRVGQMYDSVSARVRAAGASTTSFFTPLTSSLSNLRNAFGGPAAGLASLGAGAGSAAPKIDELDKKTKAYTMSAKAQAAAMRGVPAQFTDIVVSLQAGQNPFTVMLQQGGQLKDMFGGIGPAMKALGSYAMGLINPFTLAAAAAATIGLAYYQGASETKAYNIAIVESGNYVGKTALQMQEAAQRVGSLTTTTSAAAEALAALAATGKVSGSQLELVGRAVVATNDATGKSVEDVVKVFSSLADHPVKAAEELNRSTHFLSAEVADAARKMEEHGNKTGAASLIMGEYANSLIGRAATVKAQASVMERSWDKAWTSVKRYWDEVRGVGRMSEVEGDFDPNANPFDVGMRPTVGGKAKGGYSSVPSPEGNSGPGLFATAKSYVSGIASTIVPALGGAMGYYTGVNAEIAAEKKDKESASQKEAAARDKAEADAVALKAREERATAQASIAARDKANAGKEKQRAEARAQITRDFSKLEDTAANRAERDRQIRESDEKLKDPKGAKAPKNDKLKNFTQSVDRDIETFGKSDDFRKIVDLKNMGASTAQLDEYSAKLTTLQGLKDKQIRSAYDEEKALLAVKEAQADSSVVYDDNVRKLQNSLKAKKITETEYDAEMRTLRANRLVELEAQSAREVEIVKAHGAGDQTEQKRIETEKQLAKVTKDLTKARRDLNEEIQKDVDDKQLKNAEKARDLMESMQTPMEKYTRELKELNELKATQGAGFEPTFVKAQREAYRKMLEGTEAVNGSLGTMTDLALVAGRSIQTNLGSMTAALVKGDLKGIGTSFSSLVESMASKLIETNLSRLFFGDSGKLGGGGGMFDSILKSLSGGSGGGSSGGASASASGGGFFSSIGNWISGLFTGDGGGYTGTGNRSGGVDGKGGFLSILHPDETVYDHTKGTAGSGTNLSMAKLNGGAATGSSGANVNVATSVVVNVIGAPAGTEAKTEQRSDGNGGSIIDVILNAVANDVRKGGTVADAMQGTYGVNRTTMT
ncbi:MAG: phage tail length tape measure family protein [bacterium]|nr:phage tail length tape measure family protein [bacterium]